MSALLVVVSALLVAPAACKLEGTIGNLATALQDVPRYNFSFAAVPAEFGADEQYAESLGMTALPFAILLALSGAVLVPCWCAYLMCCGAGRRSSGNQRRGSAASNAALVMTLYVALLVVLAAVVCGYVANAALHRDVDATVVILNDTATRFQTDLASLNATLDALDPTLSHLFAAPINATVFKADAAIDAVKAALADVDEYEEYRLIAIHASLVPAALSAVGGIGLRQVRRLLVAWRGRSSASPRGSRRCCRPPTPAPTFAVSVAASDLCRLADNATDSGSIALLPEPERVAVQAILRCNDTRELDPLLHRAQPEHSSAFEAALDAARMESPVNNTLVNWLVGRITSGEQRRQYRIEYIEHVPLDQGGVAASSCR
jgi:hypothetical protein